MAHPQLIRKVTLAREQARSLRQSAEAALARAEALIKRATTLCARYKKVEQIAAEKPNPFSERALQPGQRSNARRSEMVEQLKRSLSDLETIRLTPADDPKLRELKEDIRKSIERAETGKAIKI